MTDRDRFERFVMQALWIIMWLLLKRSVGPTDLPRVLQWRHDYYKAGGMMVEGSKPTPSMKD